MKVYSKVIPGLKCLFDMFFPLSGPNAAPEPTTVTHSDPGRAMSSSTQNRNLAAAVDWEFVSTLPLWGLCHVPDTLQIPERETPAEADFLADDGTVNSWYWRRLKD
jgi:hypothetical protein